MRNSRWHRWKRNEREKRNQRTPFGRQVSDMPAWQISAMKAAAKPAEKKEEKS